VAETRVTDSTRLKIGAAFALAAAVAYWLPRAAEEGTQPPLSMLVVAGALIAALTTGVLFTALRFDFVLPVTVALYAVAYNGLIVAPADSPASLRQEGNMLGQHGGPRTGRRAAIRGFPG
jgi:hypothetical protein